MAERRLDSKRKVLRKGESQRADGTYDYRWTSRNGKRHSIYAKTLEELRRKEEQESLSLQRKRSCISIFATISETRMED